MNMNNTVIYYCLAGASYFSEQASPEASKGAGYAGLGTLRAGLQFGNPAPCLGRQAIKHLIRNRDTVITNPVYRHNDCCLYSIPGHRVRRVSRVYHTHTHTLYIWRRVCRELRIRASKKLVISFTLLTLRTLCPCSLRVMLALRVRRASITKPALMPNRTPGEAGHRVRFSTLCPCLLNPVPLPAQPCALP